MQVITKLPSLIICTSLRYPKSVTGFLNTRMYNLSLQIHMESILNTMSLDLTWENVPISGRLILT